MMNVYRSIDDVPYQKNTLITLGTFDGIHRGHRAIIHQLTEEAREQKARSVLITYYPHPQSVVTSRSDFLGLLTPAEEKVDILGSMGLDVVLIFPFTPQLAQTEPEDFIRDVLVKKIGVQKFVIGYNHAFGKGRRGGGDLLSRMGRQLGFSVDIIPPVVVDGENVSSTRIRKLLKAGQVRLANRLLGWHYNVRGIVKKGENVGQKLGFPTANIDVLGDKKLIPGDGVYAVFAQVEKNRLAGMANLGYRPTMTGTQHAVEVHIHDFQGDLYGKQIRIEFIERLRDEKQFDSTDALASQIAMDQKKSMELLSKYRR
jgi:riboflavin kinase/FMN adenylyltransferase